MSLRTVATLTQQELLDALRNKWFVAYAIAFVLLCVGLAMMIINSAGYTGISGFGRTAAGLINLVLFLAPLMGLTLGAQALATEREQGTLAYMLAQPVSLAEVFMAKFFGLAIAMSAAVSIGFSLSSLAIIYWSGGTGVDVFLRLLPLTLLLTLSTLSIGLIISAQASKTVTALGLAVVTWLLLVLIGSLGIMGMSIVVGLSPTVLLIGSVINPLEAFRIGAVLQIRGSLELLGPAGLVARDRIGDMTTAVLTLVMIVWIIGGAFVAYLLARRKEFQ
ncbi:MAG: ABC transporter permease [Thermomicrobiales bacterium]|nr:ABC transporter permease [Thermomicrobiales bacterium]MCO5218464.1 ABC transporter permease [Thermomicrobiales bacterium]MCO5223738.1 ABC transporter permease [Thermomicrobiales bacterium]MCO5228570.1 ABC transporter permease [Thermomicrobiales bacterium]